MGIEKSRMSRECQLEDELCGHEGEPEGVSLEIRRGCQPPLKLAALPRTIPLIRGEFLTDLRENKSV